MVPIKVGRDQKIFQKNSAFHKHGKHHGIFGHMQEEKRNVQKKRSSCIYISVAHLMEKEVPKKRKIQKK